MNQAVIPYALTTSDRVFARLSLTGTANTALINGMIAAATDFIESETNRRFLRTTYTNEVYSIYNANQKIFALNQVPVISVSSVQYRFGLKTTPNWTEFNTDDWEIVGDGSSGLLRVWGMLRNAPQSMNDINALRASYIAGYLIDFANTGTPTLHNLPYDLSDLCERLVTKLFKKRDHEGATSESFQGNSITWEKFITDTDQATMDGYKRLPVFI